MADVTFINFHNTLDEALTERTSPQIKRYEVRGIQLLPNNQYVYRQETQVPGGIDVEDWTAYIVDTCTGLEYDITSRFNIEANFVDSNGDAQFVWTVDNLGYDFGSRLVYFKINQLAAESYYSNLFQLSANDSDKTVRIDYKGVDSDRIKAIQLNMWYWQPVKVMETDVYYERSTKITRTNSIKSQKAEKWITPIMSNSLWIKVTDAMECKDVYFDLTKCNLFESPKVKEHEGENNYEWNILKVAFDSSDVLQADRVILGTSSKYDSTLVTFDSTTETFDGINNI